MIGLISKTGLLRYLEMKRIRKAEAATRRGSLLAARDPPVGRADRNFEIFTTEQFIAANVEDGALTEGHRAPTGQSISFRRGRGISHWGVNQKPIELLVVCEVSPKALELYAGWALGVEGGNRGHTPNVFVYN